MSLGSQITSTSRAALVALALFACAGCAGPIERWVVNTRVHQGEVALQRGNLQDAELSYRLALSVNPSDERARDGFVQTSADLAQSLYTRGNFDDALAAIAAGLRYDPSSVRLAALKGQIEDATLKREIVISNYPTYKDAGISLSHAYQQLTVTDKMILANIKRFSYTYDTADLTAAIKSSYDLELDVARNTNRLITYRQIVSSGVPESSHATSNVNASSLLPLP
ncbi:MAG TPA: tetratricopeptide repeat protein [Candidatus Aquilonibacter sp.]